MSPKEHKLIGQQVGRYLVHKTIGQGGMANVFLAHLHSPLSNVKKLDSPLNQSSYTPHTLIKDNQESWVALKLLHPHLADDPKAVQRFWEEISVASQLKHQHICHVLDLGEHKGIPYLIMPFLRGKSLAQLIYDSPCTRIPLPICLSIILDLAAGLSYAQQLSDSDGRPLDLIHRDVSPHNAFLEFNGYAKILDFGIAQIKKLHQSTSGTQLGKVAYMAPEQFEGTVTQQADLWSLAVTAWELLTLHPLFDADHHMKTMYQVLHADIPKLSDYRDDIPIVIENVILSALQRDNQLRPSTIKEWSQSIQNHLDQVIDMPLNEVERHQMTSRWMSDYFDLQDYIPQQESDLQLGSKSNTTNTQATTNALHSTSIMHHNEGAKEQKPKTNASSFSSSEIESNKSSTFVPNLNEVIHQSLLESKITQPIQSILTNHATSTLVTHIQKIPNQDINEFNRNHKIQDYSDQEFFIKSTNNYKKNYVFRGLIISILCISLWYLYALLDTSYLKHPNPKIMGKMQVILGDQHKAQGMLSISSYPCEAMIYNQTTKVFLGNSPLKTTLPAGMYSLLLKPSRKKKNCTPRSILVEIKEKESQIYEINLAIDHSFEE